MVKVSSNFSDRKGKERVKSCEDSRSNEVGEVDGHVPVGPPGEIMASDQSSITLYSSATIVTVPVASHRIASHSDQVPINFSQCQDHTVQNVGISRHGGGKAAISRTGSDPCPQTPQ